MILPINRSLVAARVERISSARAPEMCPFENNQRKSNRCEVDGYVWSNRIEAGRVIRQGRDHMRRESCVSRHAEPVHMLAELVPPRACARDTGGEV